MFKTSVLVVLSCLLLATNVSAQGKSADALKLYAEILALPSAPEKLKRRATEMKALIEGGMTLASLNSKEVGRVER